MAFDFGAGLANAGAAIADTAGKWTLEAQKADLETQKIKLADELAGAREEKGRAFTTSERVATQGFTSGENVLNRTNAKDIAQLSADAAVKSAGIHAGATMGAAQIGAASVDKQIASREKEHALDIATLEPGRNADVLAKTIANTNAQNVVDARKELDDATSKGDPAGVQAAKLKVYNAEYSGKDEVAKVSLYQAQAKILETALAQAQTRLVALQDPIKQMEPGTKALATSMQAQVDRLQAEFMAAVRTANEAVKGLPSYTPPGTTAAPDLNKYMRPPAASPGLVNQP